MRKFKSILSVIILLVTFILVILLFFEKVTGATPQFFGYNVLRISSQSMEPQLEVGDIILSKNIDDILSLKNGDIVTYNGSEGSYAGKLITHSIVKAPYKQNNKYYLQTQGIANDAPDPVISSDSLSGKMVCRLAVLSALYNFFLTPWGLIIILGFLAVLFINEIFALKQVVKENDNNEKIKSENSSAESGIDEKADYNTHIED